MKKNRFLVQQETIKEQQVAKNYFDDNEEVNLEQEQSAQNQSLQSSKPFEDHFQKFNEVYNEYITKFQNFEEVHQIPLTHPDYQSLIQTHFMCYERNAGLFDIVKTDKPIFDKICASFVYIDSQVSQLEETFYSKYLDKMTIYGELSDLHFQEDQQLKDGQAEIMIARMLGMFKGIYDIIKKIINYVTHLINQMNLLYNKKDPIYKSTFKQFNLYTPLDTIGRALSMIYVLDMVVEQNEYVQEHWNFYKRMIKMIKPDAVKYDTSQANFTVLEKILIRLDKTVLSGQCLQGVLQQQWDLGVIGASQKAKSSEIPPIKNNKELQGVFLAYFKDRIDLLQHTLGTSKEVTERSLFLPTLCVYALFRKLYPSEELRDQWKALWSLQKKVPFLEGHSQVLVYVSKFLMEVSPLSKKSRNMDPKDPIANVEQFLTKLTQTFPQQISSLYTQFTSWLVRMDSFATSQDSFHGIDRLSRDKADAVVEERIGQRVALVMNGLSIALQVRNLVQGLLLGHFGMEDMKLDKNLIGDIILGVEMLKAIEFYLTEKLDAFQPAFLNREITKNLHKLIAPAQSKAKSNPKVAGLDDVVSALQLVTGITRQAISPMKLLVLQYCSDFLLNQKEPLLNTVEREEYRYIHQRLDRIVLLPYYISKVTSSTYFYWCRDLLPLFIQNVYQNPSSVKRFQFLLNAISDCSRQLQNCVHLAQPMELYQSFREFVVQEFNQSYLEPLAQDIEDFLRIQIHFILIDKIHGLNPFKQQVKDIRRLLDLDQVMVFDSMINVRTEINQNLNEVFYNINVMNMYDMETYEQMRTLANFKFDLHLMNVYLPSQTIDQGSFDVLNIIKNIQGFIKRYTYNMYTQTFSEITTESKQIFTIGITQISDSIRTHGLGILSTNINSVYLYIKRKLNAFSTFLFDDYIHAPLAREERYFNDHKDELDGLYPFERAEALYKEIKKLGSFEDGKNFIDKFRILITEVGNALGFVRLIRSAQLNFCTRSVEYLPFGYQRETSFEQQAKTAGFWDASQGASKELDDVFESLQNNFSGSTDYLQMMLKVFQKINTPENSHLTLFYLIVPTLILNFIENMLIAKEHLSKKNTTECFISVYQNNNIVKKDDGFIIGVQYFIGLLNQKSKLDSLHWKKEVRTRFQKELSQAKQIVQKGEKTSQRVAEEINMQKELSLRKLNMQKDEYTMLFDAFNAAKILFMEK